jgi:hypothetical protein
MAPPRVSSYTTRKPGSKIVRLYSIHSYSTGHAFSCYLQNFKLYSLVCVWDPFYYHTHLPICTVYSIFHVHATWFTRLFLFLFYYPKKGLWRSQIRNLHIMSFLHAVGRVGSTGNACDLCSGGSRFASRSGERLSCQKFLLLFVSTCRQFQS